MMCFQTSSVAWNYTIWDQLVTDNHWPSESAFPNDVTQALELPTTQITLNHFIYRKKWEEHMLWVLWKMSGPPEREQIRARWGRKLHNSSPSSNATRAMKSMRISTSFQLFNSDLKTEM